MTRENGDLAAELAVVRAQADAAFAHSSDVVLFFSIDGTIEWVSPACRELFNLEPEQLVGLNGLDLIHPHDQERVLAAMTTIPHLRDQLRVEFRVIDTTGTIRWLEEIATNLVEDPQVGCVVANLRDVTDRVEAEAAVRFQARLLAAVGQAVIATDTRGIVSYWNAAAHATYGWSADEAIGQRVSKLVPPSAYWERLADDIGSQLRDGGSWSGELSVQPKDGAPIPVSLTNTAVFDDAGVRIGTIGVSSDISERRRSEEATALLSAIVESSRDAIFSANAAGVLMTWNGGASDLFGYTGTEMIGRHLSSVLPAGRDDDVGPVFARALRGDTVDNVDTRGQRADGTDVHVSISVSPIRTRSGAIHGTSTIARDVTERVVLLQQIEADRRRLAVAQASASLGSFEIDLATGNVVRSDELCRILGIEPGTSTGIDADYIHPDDRDRIRGLVEVASGGHEEVEATHRILRPDGVTRWVLSKTTPVRGPDSNLLVGTMLDITERHEAKLALVHQATHDGLTQLPNRTNLNDRLESVMSLCDADHLVAVAVVDIDHFKQVNDGVGHTGGDEALKAVADRLRAGLRPSDTVARVGGDEFVIARHEAATLVDADQLGADVIGLLRDPVNISDREIQLTASVGVTRSTTTDTPGSLLRDADDAMYQAKRDGRNQVVVFDHHARARAHRRQSVASALPLALERNELHLEYQPILDLASLEVAGFESLLRWVHPELGAITPDEFIPIAETTGLIRQIGAWVLDQSVRQLAIWRADPRFRPEMWMAINVSARQLAEPNLVDQVTSAIDRSGVPSGAVHLEITESVLMDRVDNALQTIIELQASGVSMSIDDFGTGYSSLSYLSRLPVDTIKIDRSFVNGLGGGAGHDTSIVRAIVALADVLALHVVAEGVETPDQLELLSALGCTYGQGWLWSRSLEAPDVVDWMIGRTSKPAEPDDAQHASFNAASRTA